MFFFIPILLALCFINHHLCGSFDAFSADLPRSFPWIQRLFREGTLCHLMADLCFTWRFLWERGTGDLRNRGSQSWQLKLLCYISGQKNSKKPSPFPRHAPHALPDSTILYPCHVTFKGCPHFPARKETLQSHHVRSASNCNNVEIREMVTLWSHKMPVSLLLKMIKIYDPAWQNDPTHPWIWGCMFVPGLCHIRQRGHNSYADRQQ